MKIFKDFIRDKKRDITVEAFDTIVDNKKEKLKDICLENKEIILGAGITAGLLVFGLMKMSHSSRKPETIVIVINNK